MHLKIPNRKSVTPPLITILSLTPRLTSLRHIINYLYSLYRTTLVLDGMWNGCIAIYIYRSFLQPTLRVPFQWYALAICIITLLRATKRTQERTTSHLTVCFPHHDDGERKACTLSVGSLGSAPHRTSSSLLSSGIPNETTPHHSDTMRTIYIHVGIGLFSPMLMLMLNVATGWCGVGGGSCWYIWTRVKGRRLLTCKCFRIASSKPLRVFVCVCCGFWPISMCCAARRENKRKYILQTWTVFMLLGCALRGSDGLLVWFRLVCKWHTSCDLNEAIRSVSLQLEPYIALTW